MAENRDDALLQRTLVDAFIIVLASANTLQLDLGQALAGAGSVAKNLEDLGMQLAQTHERTTSDIHWLLRTIGQRTGCLAKACESLDHIEDYSFKRSMAKSVRDLCEIVVIEASLRGIDLCEEAAQRHHGIEEQHIFHDRHE